MEPAFSNVLVPDKIKQFYTVNMFFYGAGWTPFGRRLVLTPTAFPNKGPGLFNLCSQAF